MDGFDGYNVTTYHWTTCDYEEQPSDNLQSTSPSSTTSSHSASFNDQGSEFVFPHPEDQLRMPQCKKAVNKLGGMYTSGKPLPLAIRKRIVSMSELGMKACDISRQLQISHGCVSKIISKWRSTGSFEPRRIGGSKPKKTIPEVIAAVRMYKRVCPSMHSLEIRRRLLADKVCTEHNVPSLSSINRIIRMKLRDEVAQFEASLVRDLMAILTGAGPSSATNCDYSPTPSEETNTEECEMEETDMNNGPSPSSSAASVSVSSSSSPPSSSVENPHSRMPLDNSFSTTTILTDELFSSSDNFYAMYSVNDLDNAASNALSHDPTTVHDPSVSLDPPLSLDPSVSHVSTVTHHPIYDPYHFSLCTPNMKDPHMQASSTFKAQNQDRNGMVLDFDVEENIWSWLDQVP